MPQSTAFGGGRFAPGRPRMRLTAAQQLAKGLEIARARLVVIRDDVTPRSLAAAMGVKLARVQVKLEELGERVKADDRLDPELAEILAQDAKMKVKREDGKMRDRSRTELPSAEETAEKGYPLRPPIVTVMGHVDHGKTTLLDALRGTKVAEGEAGGITQGVAAFSVAMRAEAVGVGNTRPPGGKGPKDKDKGKEKEKGKGGKDKGGAAAASTASGPGPTTSTSTSPSSSSAIDVMTFIDTPGHALFSSMRKRGSSVTDIVILVVDGKDGVQPQTAECVKLIQESGVPVIVAATKVDTVDPESAVAKVSKDLLALGFATEPFGGDAPVVPVSARTGQGLAELKEAIALLAELSGLRAPIDVPGEAVVMDSRIVKGMGQVVDAIVRWGAVKVGDVVVAGTEFGRVKALMTDAVGAKSLAARLAAGSAGAGAGAASGAGASPKGGKGKGASATPPPSSAAAAAAAAAASNGFALSPVDEALPGTAVRVLGLKGVPPAGTDLLVVADEEAAKAILEGRARRGQAAELLRVAAADAIKREAERAEYSRRRQRKTAYELALKRERRRRALSRSGQPIPEDLVLQPWEVAILQEGREGKVTGVSSAGKRQRKQGGQQAGVVMGYAAADAVATGEMTEAEAQAEAADGGASAPAQVAFILRADSSGSLAALEDAFARIREQSGSHVVPRCVQSGVGEVTEADVEYAATMAAHIVAFNAKVPPPVQKLAEKKKLVITAGRVIYSVLDSVCELLGEFLPTEQVEEVVGAAEVKAVFDLNANKKSEPDRVAGCVIVEGTFPKTAALFRVLRGGPAGAVQHEGTSLTSLRIHKEAVESVAKGKDCGVAVDGFREYAVGDRIVAIKRKDKKKKLEVNFG
jgi:small GTP-binding protein